MAWIFLVAAISCSILLSHLLKTIEHKQLSRIRVLTINYLAAASVAVIQSVVRNESLQIQQIPMEVYVISIFLGFMFIAVFFALSKSIHLNGVGVSVTSMRISLILPVAAGFVFFNEIASPIKITGIALVLIALVLLVKKDGNPWHKPDKYAWLLLFIFIATGLNDVLLKAYEVFYSGLISESWFTAILFTTSFLCGTIYLMKNRKMDFKKSEVAYGIIIGVVNLYSTVFLLYALGSMEASFVFPVLNICVVIGSTLVGLLYWQDTLSKMRWLGLAMASISLVLLF